jgi:hypothetical protein
MHRLEASGHQVEQHIPGGIGEQVGSEKLVAQPPRPDDRPHPGRVDRTLLPDLALGLALGQ